ncbi:MAG: IS1595 family transposase [Humidesulfovibrio sp.]|uniref:IS1595 family transposase n=1 Tax=Humidesulfovibrio sp. TaxID=2910988 RepID=UPI0027E5F317|nr:IS1595 family transposase [Humidesulfovibrio sp.]MDQ7835729.1 IS1595 family transposase [Humidesulfovibrio sp.]
MTEGMTTAGEESQDAEARARATLLWRCWPDGKKFCPRCRAEAPYALAEGRLRCGACRYTFHDFTGRWLNLSGLTPAQWIELARAFALDASTREAALATGISYNTAFKALTVLRLAILAQGADANQLFSQQTGLSDLFSNSKLCPAPEALVGEVPVYGILSQGRRVFVDMVPELTAESVLHFNHNFHLRVARLGHILITDRYKTYDGLILCGDDRLPYHYLLRHQGSPFAEAGSPFWLYARDRLRQFKGLSARRFPLYLKELELRYNRQGEDLLPLFLDALCAPIPSAAPASANP